MLWLLLIVFLVGFYGLGRLVQRLTDNPPVDLLDHVGAVLLGGLVSCLLALVIGGGLLVILLASGYLS